VVGPPDVTDVRLPSDSLAAAQAELDVLLTRLGALVADDAATARRLAADEPALAAARRERDDLRARHRRHAAAVYEALSAGALADEEMRSLKPDLESARQRVLLEAATGAEVRRTERVERRAASLDRSVTAATRRRTTLARDITSTRNELTVVLAKLAAATSAITLVGTPTPAAAAAGPLAAAAADAEGALVAATVARWGSPLAAALTAADYTVKRTTLAGLVAATLRPTGDAIDPAALDVVWAAAPEPAMRAVLFALSQLGKPYVYATDGPATYDCSGLTRRAWAESGIGLPHFSGAQLHTGLPVAPAHLRPGDLLAYGPDGTQHVVLYVGAGTVVQAEGRAWGVVVTPINFDPARGFAGASRPVP
jgi:cell wall-associated NlpC family hydrolase